MRKKKQGEKADQVVTIKLTPGERHRLDQLSRKEGLGPSSKAADIVRDYLKHTHHRSAKPALGFVTTDLAGSRLLNEHAKHAARVRAALDRLRSQQTEHREHAEKRGFIDIAWFAGEVDAATRELRMHESWHDWSSGRDPVGKRHDAYEAAWIAGDIALAEQIARGVDEADEAEDDVDNG